MSELVPYGSRSLGRQARAMGRELAQVDRHTAIGCAVIASEATLQSERVFAVEDVTAAAMGALTRTITRARHHLEAEQAAAPYLRNLIEASALACERIVADTERRVR
jgi:hypothetical protein